jgi:hypothetical protein
METIEIIIEETVQPIILEVYQEITPPIVLESYEGKSGDSAYVEAVKNGFIGTEIEWLASLKGDKGDVGEKGDKGDTGEKGDKGDKGDSGTNVIWGDITGSLNDQVDLQNALDNKVDKVAGYSLTKNDFTDVLKAKLDSITAIFTTDLKTTYDSAVSWISTNGNNLINHLSNTLNPHNTTASQVGAYTTSEVDNITNNKVDKITGKGLSTNDYTTVEKTKLSTVASGAEVNVNADWNATSGDAEILNKPTIPSISGLATVSYVDSQDTLKVDKVSGKSLISDSEITRLSTVTNFDNSGNVTALANKVDKITGYSLTKNDLTDALKTAYDNAVSSLATLLATGSRLITSGEITKLSNTSGTNTGDQDLSGKVDKVTGKSLINDTEITRIGTMATNANVGVVPNSPITGATKLKTTFDSKGLVTAGADATTADVADSTNRRYVTDAQLVVVGNTSGTNSGDNATNSQYSGLASSKEDTANKTNLTSDSGSTTKFPVFATILSYFDASRIRTLLGISTLSGSNTGDETSATILSKLGYTPIKSVIKDTAVSSTITGVTTETITGTYLIPANTYNANDIAKITSFLAERAGVAGTVTMRVKVGTSATFGSATTIATYTTGATELWCIMQRMSITLRGGNLRVLNAGNSRQTDATATSLSISTVAFNPAVDNYLFTSLQLSMVTDSVFQSNITVTN